MLYSSPHMYSLSAKLIAVADTNQMRVIFSITFAQREQFFE